MKKEISEIIALKEFQAYFKKLVKIDKENATNMKNALLARVSENHKHIKENENNDKLAYYLSNEISELSDFFNKQFSCTKELEHIELKLVKFAINQAETFLDSLCDNIENYFDKKKEIIYNEIEKESKWYTNFHDTKQIIHRNINKVLSNEKMSSVIHNIKSVINSNSDKKNQNNDEQQIIGSLIETTLEKHLSKEILAKDIAKILKKENSKMKKNWIKEINKQVDDINIKFSFEGFLYGSTVEQRHEIGIETHTAVVGLGAATVGTLGLAAGWHTLSYSMMNVFPPLLFFAAFASIGMAFFTHNKAINERKKQIHEILNNMKKYFIISIYDEPLKDLNNKTLRKSILDRNLKIVRDTILNIHKSVFGNITKDQIIKLDIICKQHVQEIKQLIDKLLI